MILVIIGSFPIVSTLQIPPKVMAQAPSEGAKVLIDDAIQALKSNDINRAQMHLNILNQQLPAFVNSSSIQSVKVLLDDVGLALKSKDVNNALIHLNLVKQQLTPNGSSTTTPSPSANKMAPEITNVQVNHPPKAYDDNISVIHGSQTEIKLRANDNDGDPIKFSLISKTTWGNIKDFNVDTGDLVYEAPEICGHCTDKFSFQVTDNHNTTSNIAQVSISINRNPEPDQLSQPSMGSEGITTSEAENNENPPSAGTDYSSICAKLQPVLIPSCSTLVNSDGSLTPDGTHAMHCIRNGILLGGGAAALTSLPLSIILKGLSMLAAPTGCDGIVDMKAFDQLGGIGSLSSLANLLP